MVSSSSNNFTNSWRDIPSADTSQTSRVIVTIVIFTISFLGLLSNLAVFLFAATLKSLKNSFGRLSASQSFAEAILCSVFVFFYCPMVLLDVPLFKFLSSYVGLILLFCYDVCIFSHLFIAVNRFCAISTPIEYNIIFSDRNTRILIFIAYAIPCFTSIYMHLSNNCLLPYMDFGWYFGVNTSADCDTIRYYIDFCKDFGIVALIAIIDILTVLMIRLTASSLNNAPQSNNSIAERKRNREIKFVKQCLIQGAVFATELVFFFLISARQSNPWAIFMCTTVAWTLVHSIDPMILILLNNEFRRMILRNPFSRTSSRVQQSVRTLDQSSTHT